MTACISSTTPHGNLPTASYCVLLCPWQPIVAKLFLQSMTSCWLVAWLNGCIEAEAYSACSSHSTRILTQSWCAFYHSFVTCPTSGLLSELKQGKERRDLTLRHSLSLSLSLSLFSCSLLRLMFIA